MFLGSLVAVSQSPLYFFQPATCCLSHLGSLH